MASFLCSWYNKDGYLRIDRCETKRQTDGLAKVVAGMGGTDFQRGVAGTKRPHTKEAKE